MRARVTRSPVCPIPFDCRGGWNVGGVHVRVKEVSHDRCHVWHVNNACTSVMARLWTYTTSSGEERNLVTFLECGELYEYSVPSFPVISVELRRMKYESIMPDGKSTKVVDGFIREDTSLKRSFPADITIGEGYQHACIVPVSFARWHIFRSLGPEFAASRIAWPMI